MSGAVLLLLGLAAMHGLSLDHTIMSPKSPMHAMTAANGGQPAVLADGACVTDGVQTMADHPQCLVTRPSDPPHPNPTAFVLTPAFQRDASATLATLSRTETGRAPPDVSLTRLCVSRT